MLSAAAASTADTARALGAAGAAVIALQEADASYAGRQELRQWERLGESLSMDYRFLPALQLNAAGIVRACSGVAILSSFPIVAARPIAFSQRRVPALRRLRGRLFGRKRALHCTLAVGGREVHVVSAHLTHDLPSQRERELETLLDYCAPLGTVILAGDLNFTPPRSWRPGEAHPQPIDDRCPEILREFRDRYPGRLLYDARLGDFRPGEAAMDQLATCEATRPRYKFDYIFVLTHDPEISLEPETVMDYQASDHRPVIATVVFHDDQGVPR